MKSPVKYLSVKLFLLLTGLLLLIFGARTYIDIRMTSRGLTDYVYSSADRASDLIVRSTRYSMLLNRKDDVHQIIKTVGDQPGVVEINIYNKAGATIFSTDSLRIGQRADLQAEACVICHASGSPLVSVPAKSRMRVYESEHQGHVLGLINPIRNEPACYNASCHAHSPDQSVLGVLDVKMSLTGVDDRVASARHAMIASSLLSIVFISFISGLFIYRFVRKPIRKLNQGMSAVASGELHNRIEIESNDEIGELAESYNTMARDLAAAREQVEEWTHTLEDRISQKTQELERTQAQMLHMEKMASLGKLSASIAHEINNPLFGILTYAKLGQRELAEGSNETGTDVARYLSIIEHESSRAGDIVKSLLDFARQSGGEFSWQHLNAIIEHALVILGHHFEMREIEVEKHLMEGNDDLYCDPKQIQQAIMAPCINAVEAMPNRGVLTIRTTGDEESVTVEICDTGVGISEEVLPRIFDPFFTTKEGESGLGLGLSVVYGIVRRHGGTIRVASKRGEGSTIVMTLPREPRLEELEGSEEDVPPVEHHP